MKNKENETFFMFVYILEGIYIYIYNAMCISVWENFLIKYNI